MSLQVWLPLTKDLRQQGLDNVSITTNTGATFVSNGKLGGCYSFDGVDDWMQGVFDKTKYSGKPMSLACWFKSDKSDAGGAIIDLAADLCLGYTYNSNGIQFTAWRCYKNSSNNRTGSSSVTSTYYNADNWHHIVDTFEGGIEKIYVDGVLSQIFDHTNLYTYNWTPLLASNYNKISIGKSAGDSNWIGGLVNDVRIYDHCLSPMEVKELAKGLVLHYPLNGGGLLRSQYDSTIYTEPDGSLWARIFHHNNPAGSLFASTDTFVTGIYKDANRWYDVEGICNSVNKWEFMLKQKDTSSSSEVKYRWIQLHNPTTATWSNVSPSSGNITHITTSGYSTSTTGAGMYKINGNNRMTIANANNGNWYGAIGCWTAYNNGIPGYPNTTCTSGYMDLYIRIDNLGGITEYDCSGFCNNGTRTGTFTWTSDTPKYNVSQVFSGSQYIVESNEINTTDSTIALWIKSALSANAHILDARNSNEVGKQPIYQYTNGSIQAGGNNGYVTTNTGLLVANTWVHVALVQSGNSLLVYKNGTLFQTISCNNSPIIKPTIGARLNFSNKWTGQLSDVRIYATALSADDVLSLYQNSAYIDSSGNVYGAVH